MASNVSASSGFLSNVPTGSGSPSAVRKYFARSGDWEMNLSAAIWVAEAELENGNHDLIAFGTSYIANPDLVERMRNGWPLAESDRSTFYGVIGAKGYTDYESYQG